MISSFLGSDLATTGLSAVCPISTPLSFGLDSGFSRTAMSADSLSQTFNADAPLQQRQPGMARTARVCLVIVARTRFSFSRIGIANSETGNIHNSD
jgi:hypothetical protein